MTNDPSPHESSFLPSELLTKPSRSETQQTFLDQWIENCIEIDVTVITRLSGENSLYEAYKDSCRSHPLKQVPLSRRTFTKRLEFLLELHFQFASTKTRDFRGTLFPGLKVKSTPLQSKDNRPYPMLFMFLMFLISSKRTRRRLRVKRRRKIHLKRPSN